MAVTIEDVAKHAGVGVGTVSRVLNNSPLVRPATRARVVQAIVQLDYRVDQIARRRRPDRTQTVAIIGSCFNIPSFIERLRGVHEVFVDDEYRLILVNVETPNRRDESLRQILRPGQVDGALIISCPLNAEEMPVLASTPIPLVTVDVNALHSSEFNRIIVDDVRGGQIATEHLIELGHRRIAFLGDPPDHPMQYTSSTDRLAGYRRAFLQHGLAYKDAYVVQGEHSRENAHALARMLLRRRKRPTAIVASSDTQALGVLDAARELDLAVPTELSVVGYDDIPAAATANLTTVRQHLFDSGRSAALLLLELMSTGRGGATTVELPVELVVRLTTMQVSRP